MRSVVVVLPYHCQKNAGAFSHRAYCIDMGNDANVPRGFRECIRLERRLREQQSARNFHIMPNNSTSTHPSDPHTNDSANAIDKETEVHMCLHVQHVIENDGRSAPSPALTSGPPSFGLHHQPTSARLDS
jgi:hypothetical protein